MSLTRNVSVAGLAACLGIGMLPAAAQPENGADSDWMHTKSVLREFGEEHETAWDLYQTLKAAAGVPDMPSASELPDWSGLWTRQASPFVFDPDQSDFTQPPQSVELTPEYEEELVERIEAHNRGVAYDPLSECGTPVGFPRWFAEPFLREFVPKPHQTWLIIEQQSEVRRVYTDGRGHTPEAYATQTPNGDTIGFWDDDRLIAHTQNVSAGMIQRVQPRTSDKVEGVEIWERVDENTMQVDLWVYDPEAFVEPWYTRQIYRTVPQPAEGKPLRIRFWDCTENSNNAISQTEDGGSTFSDLEFTEEDD